MAIIQTTRRRILVTGGAGFIGSHLCDRLIALGHHVICVDNLSTGTAENIAHLRADTAFSFLHQDVTQPLRVDVDEIYHLACPASPKQYQTDPVRTMRTSLLGAMNVLDLAQQKGCRVLLASTSEVYGDPERHPQTEEYWGHVNPIGPRACYDESKRCAETMFFDFHRQYGTDIRVARIFNTYGPRLLQTDGRVVSNFIFQAMQGVPITLFGDGTHTRSFCYVSDLVEGLIALMNHSGAQPGPVNLGNPSEITMQQLADEVLAQTASPSIITLHPLPKDDPKRRCPDISKAMDLLGWAPEVHLQDGLRKTIAYFKRKVPLAVHDVPNSGRATG